MNIEVPPEGPTQSPLIALVGEAPGREEELKLRPFIGASGFLLDQMLNQAGIVRSSCYVTNVVKTRPPSNNFRGTYYTDKKGMCPTPELLQWRERLQAEIRAVKPKIIIALGAEAMKALTPYSSISNYRGTMINKFGLRVLPTYHPASVLRSYDQRPIVEADFKKALRQAMNPSVPKTFLNPTPSFSEVMAFIRERPRRLSLDIETIANTTRCIGLGKSRHEAICIPIIGARKSYWTQDEETEILIELDKLFRCPDVGFYLQNSPYDFTILARDFGFQIANLHLDTMFAHHLLFPELPKGLDFLCSVYTDHPMYWGYDSGNDAETREYCCTDCIVTFEAAEDIEEQLHQRKLWDYYKSVVHRAVPPMTRCQSRGVLIDQVAREEIRVETEAQMLACQVKLHELLGFNLNPSSPPQVGKLVYDTWGLPIQRKPGHEGRTTDEDALKILRKKTSDSTKQAVIDNIISYRQKRVLVSTFVDMALKDGRVHTSYNIAGTVTGRLASSSTFDGYGGNLQNIPRGRFRRIFKADPGKVLIKADLSQAEYRILIWKARIRRVIERFLTDPKFSVHMWNAAENIYQVPYDQVTKKMYDEAKNGVYGANYGIGPHKVSRMYEIDFQQAKFIIERYHRAVPEIKGVYQKEIEDQVKATRTIVNPHGRERIFMGRMDDDLFRQAYSHYCQSCVGDLIMLALIELDDAGMEILLQVHDELVCQVPVECVDEGCALVKRCMERPMQIEDTPEPLVIPAEIKVGFDWFNVKSLPEFKQSLLTPTIDNNKGYNKENCRWTSQGINIRNRGY